MGGPECIWLQPEGTEYVRSDLYDALRAQVELLHGSMLRVQVRLGQPGILENLNSVRSIVNAALAKSTGSPDDP